MTLHGIARQSKDLDLYIKPDEKDRLIALLGELGYSDYYDQLAYDRGWIYRAASPAGIVDVIWQMANRRAAVDEFWISRGPLAKLGWETVRLIPIEEMIWNRLYVLQKDRCDWPDILNLIDVGQAAIDWGYLAGRLGDDLPLLRAVLEVYCWLRPGALRLPEWLQNRASCWQLPAAANEDRAPLLDSRHWLRSAPEK